MKRPSRPGTGAPYWVAVLFLVGLITLARAQSDPDLPDNDHSPYHRALLNYKAANYDAARVFIDEAEKGQPDSIPVEMLKVRILTEQHDYGDAARLLQNVGAEAALTPADGLAITLATGDLELRQHHFEQAAKQYASLLAQKPDQTDVKLKLIYAQIGANDLVAAGKYASELKPLDPNDPAYYFARAALAKETNDSTEEEQDLQQARTIYGITMTNRYLKTYLEVFAVERNSISNALNPPTAETNNASGAAKP